MQEYLHTLVATVGGQPQIVTLTLDLLLRESFHIDEVMVVHPAPGSDARLRNTLECLREEFANGRYPFQDSTLPCRLRLVELRHDGHPLRDIIDNDGAHVVEGTIYRLIKQLKEQQRHIHLSASGGRRIMSLMAVAAAQRNFDRFDHIWHIFTPPEVREQVKEGKLMHVSPAAGVKLIEVPFVPAFSYPAQWPGTTRDFQKALISPDEHARCQQVVDGLTPTQSQVLKAFARGRKPQEVATELGLSMSTIDSHKTLLLARCRAAWNLDEKASLNYHFFSEKFRLFWT